MKTLYAALASIALLFSLPALAAPLAEKAMEPSGNEKESHETAPKDVLDIDTGPKQEAKSPMCRGEGSG